MHLGCLKDCRQPETSHGPHGLFPLCQNDSHRLAATDLVSSVFSSSFRSYQGATGDARKQAQTEGSAPWHCHVGSSKTKAKLY